MSPRAIAVRRTPTRHVPPATRRPSDPLPGTRSAAGESKPDFARVLGPLIEKSFNDASIMKQQAAALRNVAGISESEHADLLAHFGATLGSLDSVIVATDHKVIVEILHHNDGDPLTDEQARETFARLIGHGDDLKAASDEGGTTEPDEIRDTLVKVARDAFALVRTFDARKRQHDDRDFEQARPRA